MQAHRLCHARPRGRDGPAAPVLGGGGLFAATALARCSPSTCSEKRRRVDFRRGKAGRCSASPSLPAGVANHPVPQPPALAAQMTGAPSSKTDGRVLRSTFFSWQARASRGPRARLRIRNEDESAASPMPACRRRTSSSPRLGAASKGTSISVYA